MADSEATEPQPDPGGIQTAIDRYRELAKYLITIFAAIGGLLLAGTQLTAIGEISFEDDAARAIAAVLGIIAAFAGLLSVIDAALRVLTPIEMSLRDVEADPSLREKIEARRSQLAGLASIRELIDLLEGPLLKGRARETWARVARGVADRAAFYRARDLFDNAIGRMMCGALIAALGIFAFVWGANPPDGGTDPVGPAPTEVTVALTEKGKEKLGKALGPACSTEAIHAVAIGGGEDELRVLTLPESGCNLTQFVLGPALGELLAAVKAPAP